MRGETLDSWKERLPEIIDGYAKDNVWNMDETGVLFFKALPDRGLGPLDPLKLFLPNCSTICLAFSTS